MLSIVRFTPLASLALLLSACGGQSDVEELDNRLAAKSDADPALTASLEDQIMVDTGLAGQSNDDAIRPPREPAMTPVPPDMPGKDADGQTLGSLAAQQGDVSRDAFNGCGLSVKYSASYAAKLPADLPLFPGAKVIEAAGSDDNDCKLRAVSFAAATSSDALASHYVAAAKKAGYTPAIKAEGKGKLVSGRRAADGAAFYVIVQPQGNEATADLVVNNGA